VNNKLFENANYKQITQHYISDTLAILFEQNMHFSIICDVKYLEFEPQLPHEIYEQFGSNVLFSLSGYTYDSAKIDEGYFVFEAGFGKDNFGAVVAMPLLAIKQLIVDETPILINITTPQHEHKRDEEGINNSMTMLLNNPENQKLLNKVKKGD